MVKRERIVFSLLVASGLMAHWALFGDFHFFDAMGAAQSDAVAAPGTEPMQLAQADGRKAPQAESKRNPLREVSLQLSAGNSVVVRNNEYSHPGLIKKK